MDHFIFFGNSNSVCFILIIITRLRGVDEHVAEVYCRLVEGLTGPQGGVTTSLVPHKHLKLLTIFPILGKIISSDPLSDADKITDDSTHDFPFVKAKSAARKNFDCNLVQFVSSREILFIHQRLSTIHSPAKRICPAKWSTETFTVKWFLVDRPIKHIYIESFNIAKRMRRNQTHPQNKGLKLK